MNLILLIGPGTTQALVERRRTDAGGRRTQDLVWSLLLDQVLLMNLILLFGWLILLFGWQMTQALVGGRTAQDEVLLVDTKLRTQARIVVYPFIFQQLLALAAAVLQGPVLVLVLVPATAEVVAAAVPVLFLQELMAAIHFGFEYWRVWQRCRCCYEHHASGWNGTANIS